ncbi:MAG TPA: 16S rRNA (adenine(1518)-N(6)/adenine(1519)-N(6))-dimethyltransferase RsmA [Acidimicrobiia bacterium]|nr:16S rRNA (adenine(1518)-N(6)/adenine(1519)-N(6))-dimethyltransferase RsmA [Acidimicrobiia bacterium]
MTAQTLAEMRALLERFGLRPRPSLGQHFLADPNLTRRIVREAQIVPGDLVLEVGAGTGTLTRALAEAGASVTAVEVDERLQPVLEEVLAGLGVQLLIADALSIDYGLLLGDASWKAVANLPYQVGTQLILDWLRMVPAISEITAMVQLEVAQRLAAEPGSDAYGLPSVIARLHGRVKIAFRVPPHVFYPPPRVESAVVRIVRQPTPALADRAVELAAAGFAQRRKMLRGSLSVILPHPERQLRMAGIDPTSRAETLSPEDFLRLAEMAT